jgi:hypothetical protein
MMSNLKVYGAVAAVAIAPVALMAQAAQPAAHSETLPVAGVHYRYWPEQLVQWIGPELPYSMIVLDVDDRGKEPVYDAQLVDKSGKDAVHYTNSAAELALDQRLGFTVHQVAMKFDGPADPANGAQYMLRFNTEKGVPVVWQFVLGTDVTEQGSGVTPVAAAVPVLIYREQGGLAGQGTAVQIGGVTSTAEVWKELAQPPYFLPYRGALSTGVHIVSFTPTATAWKQDGQALTDKAADTLSVEKSGDTVTLTNAALGVAETETVAGNAVSRVSFGPVKAKKDDTVSLEFTPALAPGVESSFDMIAGKKTKIAAGKVEASADSAGNGETWSFTKPDALRGKEVKASAEVQQ